MDIDGHICEVVERALAMANAPGVDLNIGRPAPQFENYQPHTDPPSRRGVQYHGDGSLKDHGIPGVYGALGRQTRSSVDRAWTRHELEFAAAQMDPLEFAAVLWCTGELSVRSMLKHELLIFALEVKEIERWPPLMRRVDCELTGRTRDPRYVLDLCTLALLEGMYPHTYGREAARALYFGVSDRHWRRCGLAAGYAAVSGKLTNWFNNGIVYLHSHLVARAA